jgi:hypothetical protein
MLDKKDQHQAMGNHSAELTLGSFETLGILKEAMVAMLAALGAAWGTVAAFFRQRLSGEKLPRRFVAMTGTEGIVASKLQSGTGG